MSKKLLVLTIAFSLTGAATAKRPTDSKADRAAINKTSEAVRAAFARGDVPAILSYHHPDVTKALISPLRVRRREAIQDCGFGVFEIEQTQDGFAGAASSSESWSMLHDRWPPCHRSMIRVFRDE
jgi:hypothetical protein